MFGQFGWTKGGPHDRELTKFYLKIELSRALPIYIYRYGHMIKKNIGAGEELCSK